LDVFYSGITDEIVQKRREIALGTTRDDLVEIASELILKPLRNGHSTKVIFGSDTLDLEEFKDKGIIP